MGAPFLKALPTCLYVGQPTETSGSLRPAAQLQYCPVGGGGGGGSSDSGCWTLTTFNSNRTRGCLSVRSTATDKLCCFIFQQESTMRMCVSFSNVCTAEAHVHQPSASVFAAPSLLSSPPHPPCGSSSDALVRLQIFYKMQRCWPFEWDSQIFFTW